MTTKQQLEDYFKKTLTLPCSRCGNTDFILASNDSDVNTYGVPSLASGTNNMNFSTHLPIYAIACSNCGHIDSFSRILVDNKIKAENTREHTEGK